METDRAIRPHATGRVFGTSKTLEKSILVNGKALNFQFQYKVIKGCKLKRYIQKSPFIHLVLE